MPTENWGESGKAGSNHWFMTYIPDAVAVAPNRQDAVLPPPGPATLPSYWHSYGSYLTFLVVGCLAVFTQIAVVHPTDQARREAALEAFAQQHSAVRSQHERLARVFHLRANFDTIHGFQSRISAAKEEHRSQEDFRNATKMYLLAREDWDLAQMEQQDAEAWDEKAVEDHVLYLEYLKNASLYQQRAEVLNQEAQVLANRSTYYQRVFAKHSAMAQEQEHLEEGYLSNATYEGQVSQNITRAEQSREDHMLICRWSWTRRYICGMLGGVTALGEAEKYKEDETADYQRAMDLDQQVMLEETKAMIAGTQAARTAEEARLDRLQAEEMNNASLADEILAALERDQELDDLQQELEDLKSAHEHLNTMEHYEALEVDLEVKSRQEDILAHDEFDSGTKLLDQGAAEQRESEAEWDLVAAEAEKQRQMVALANRLGRRVRLFSCAAAAYALISLAFFIMAMVTTNTVSLGSPLKRMAMTLSATLLRSWEGRNTHWEGQTILGDRQGRNSLRQLSCWFHHWLCFLVVAGIQGGQLSTIFAVDSWQKRGDALILFALSGGLLETVLFQAIPHAIVLPSLNREYFRNIAVRVIASTCIFAIQMLLLLILCGQDSQWLFGWIKFLHRFYIILIILLMITSSVHMWTIEVPYAVSLDRNNSLAISDVTLSARAELTIHQPFLSNTAVLVPTAHPILDEESAKRSTMTGSSPRSGNHETEGLLTVYHEATSAPYSSISLASALTGGSGVNPILFPSPELERLYEVSIQDEFFEIVAYVELVLLAGILLVLFASLPKIAHQ